MTQANLRPLADVIETAGITIVAFREPLVPDGRDYGAEAIDTVVKPLVDHNAARKLVLDLAAIGYLSSHAIGKLIMVRKKLAEKRGELWLCGARPEVTNFFKIAGLDKLVGVVKTRDEALAALGAGKRV